MNIVDDLRKNTQDQLVESLVDVAVAGSTMLVPDVIGKIVIPIGIRTISDTIMYSIDQIGKSSITDYQQKEASFVILRAQNRFSINNNGDVQDVVSQDYLDNSFEFGYRMILNAMRESQRKKLPLLGDYWGNVVSENREQWDEYHNVAEIITSLSFRKIVLIKMISDGFSDCEDDLCVTNPMICLELNQLLQLGIWSVNGARLGTNNVANLRVKELVATQFCNRLVQLMALAENITMEEIETVRKDMRLKITKEFVESFDKSDMFTSQSVDEHKNEMNLFCHRLNDCFMKCVVNSPQLVDLMAISNLRLELQMLERGTLFDVSSINFVELYSQLALLENSYRDDNDVYRECTALRQQILRIKNFLENSNLTIQNCLLVQIK